MDEDQKLQQEADEAAAGMADAQLRQAGLIGGAQAQLIHSIAQAIIENNAFACQAAGLLALLVQEGLFEYPSCALLYNDQEMSHEDARAEVTERMAKMQKFIGRGVETLSDWAAEDEQKQVPDSENRTFFLMNILYQIVVAAATAMLMGAKPPTVGPPPEGYPQA